MYTTTNYGFNIVEGTDMVNPLTQLNPNFTALDTYLKAVSNSTVDNATCIKTGTVHAVTRVNTSTNVFIFTATGNWNTGDTMTVDGTLVSVYTSDGSAPSDGCYVINSEVLAAIQGTRVTLYVNSGDASNISFDDTSVSYTANNVQTAINAASTADGTEYSSGVSVKDKIDGMLVSTGVQYDADNNNFAFINPSVPKPRTNQLTLVGRNTTTGAIHLVWYNSGQQKFMLSTTLVGNAPSNGNIINIEYQA